MNNIQHTNMKSRSYLMLQLWREGPLDEKMSSQTEEQGQSQRDKKDDKPTTNYKAWITRRSTNY
jgi:hypothetical protein